MAHVYRASVVWERRGEPFTDNRYGREHRWLFDEGLEVPASASPLHVRAPMSRADAVDPEEAFVAALSSCHMLFFLSFAARAGFVVDCYRDEALGTMGRAPDGRDFVREVRLRPAAAFAGERQPSDEALERLHHEAHEACYLANSVKTAIVVEPQAAAMPAEA